jgi:hypothetical protein
MSGSHGRKQQQKLQKAKKKRELARRAQKARKVPTSTAALIQRAAKAPFGPIWVSEALEDGRDAGSPALITVIVTRRVAGLLLPLVVLVDRTCLGVKQAFVGQLMAELDCEHMAGSFAERGDRLQRAELVVAQSVIYHAIDYAESLGFAPHQDFKAEMLGARPEVLLDTFLCRPERPLYVAGPGDNVARIASQLRERAGEGNYEVVADLGDLSGLELGDLDWEVPDDDDDADLDVLDTEGSVVEEARDA